MAPPKSKPANKPQNAGEQVIRESEAQAADSATRAAVVEVPELPPAVPEVHAEVTEDLAEVSEVSAAAPENPETVAEVPAAIGEIIDHATIEAKDETAAIVMDAVDTEVKVATQVVVAAQELTNLVDDSSSTASKGLSALGLTAIEHARANARAYLDHVNELLRVRSVPEAIELNMAFAKKTAETLAAQAKEFGELAQKTATEAVGSMKTHFDKTFRRAA